MKQNIKMIELCSKIGVFFGSCDGDYCESERKFVSGFLSKYKTDETIKDEIDSIEKRVFEEKYTIGGIIDESNQVLDNLMLENRQPARELLGQFIEAVINADGVLHPNEVKFYEQWKNSVR